MKRVVEITDPTGFEALLGENVILLCLNYFYTGILTGVNATQVELTDPKMVYETGVWSEAKWKDAQAIPGPLYVRITTIEAYAKTSKV